MMNFMAIMAASQAASGGGGGPVACSITLSGAIGPAAGLGACDVDGQTFSLTSVSTGSLYFASTPFATAPERRAMPASGKKVWAQFDSSTVTGGNALGGFAVIDGSGTSLGFVQVSNTNSTQFGGIIYYNAALTPQHIISMPGSIDLDYVTLGIDDAGEVYMYDQQSGAVIDIATLNASVAGYFAGASTLYLFGQIQRTSTVTGTMTMTTAQPNMTDVQADTVEFDGDEDWCGNAIAA